MTGPAMTEACAPRAGESGLIFGAGMAVILTALAAMLLPLAAGRGGAGLIACMMIVAGSIEVLAGAFRPGDRAATIMPGLVTVTAGAFFWFEPFGAFVPQVRLVMAWLVARSLLLGFASLSAAGSLRLWTVVAAATDAVLAAMLFTGLSASTFVIALFGPTSDVVAAFAWILGASLFASGLLLLEIGRSRD